MTWRTGRWRPGAAVSRRASIGLGLILLTLAGIAIVRSRAISADNVTAGRAVALADSFQDARYYASVENAELSAYWLARQPATLVAYEQATDSLDTTLAVIAGRDHNADANQIDGLMALQSRYEVLADQVLALMALGQDDQAATLQRARVDPASDQLRGNLGVLEEAHHRQAVAELRSVHRGATRLAVATPVALVIALVLLGSLALLNRAHRRALQTQTLHDVLTGLPNRLLLADRSAQALAASVRTGAQPVVMVVDLDRFKEVNDTLGHQYGDLLLVQVAARLAQGLRPGDTVARLGSDEFAVLLVDGGVQAGIEVAQRILKCLEPAFDLDGFTASIEASIGIAVSSLDLTAAEPVDAAELLLRHADMAMFEAKAKRCGFVQFTAASDSRSTSRLGLLGELREALDHDQLVLHYQPKVAADTGDLVGIEALVRWNHPTRGVLPPGEFIGLAENTTLIQRLTTVVIDKALAFSCEQLRNGHRLPVAVNVSARSLLDLGFPGAVLAQLTAAGLPAELLCLEITESTIMADPAKALSILRALDAMGVQLSVDDFGTGYSSMSYLKILPVHELKIDRSFVAHMTTDHHDEVLVESAIVLGHNLGLSVVAEGVEDEPTFDALKALGVDVIQGYYLGRPMPGEKLSQWMADRAALASA
jgi:diguanylate cyclase (GGDEF)-like protein